jgi:hypothetical protein
LEFTQVNGGVAWALVNEKKELWLNVAAVQVLMLWHVVQVVGKFAMAWFGGLSG